MWVYTAEIYTKTYSHGNLKNRVGNSYDHCWRYGLGNLDYWQKKAPSVKKVKYTAKNGTGNKT